MHYIVFDLEWNIAGRANKVDAELQQAMPFEIIEIGAVKLNESFEMISKFSVTIRPKLYPVLSGHVAAVTRRLQQSLRYGLTFPDAARDFLNFCGEDFIFCTWSESDTSVLKQNLAFYDFDDVLAARCIDVQFVFDDVIEQADTQRSIEYAVDFLNLSKLQPFHQAVQDAWYTGRILEAIMAECRVNPALPVFKPVDYAYDPNLQRSAQKTLSGLSTPEAVVSYLQDETLLCPACGQIMQRIQDWERQGGKATASFVCPDHGKVNGKARFRIKSANQVIAYLALRLERGLGMMQSMLPEQTSGSEPVLEPEQF